MFAPLVPMPLEHLDSPGELQGMEKNTNQRSYTQQSCSYQSRQHDAYVSAQLKQHIIDFPLAQPHLLQHDSTDCALPGYRDSCSGGSLNSHHQDTETISNSRVKPLLPFDFGATTYSVPEELSENVENFSPSLFSISNSTSSYRTSHPNRFSRRGEKRKKLNDDIFWIQHGKGSSVAENINFEARGSSERPTSCLRDTYYQHHRNYWGEFPIPTGVTDDDNEDEMSDETDEMCLKVSHKRPNGSISRELSHPDTNVSSDQVAFREKVTKAGRRKHLKHSLFNDHNVRYNHSPSFNSSQMFSVSSRGNLTGPSFSRNASVKNLHSYHVVTDLKYCSSESFPNPKMSSAQSNAACSKFSLIPSFATSSLHYEHPEFSYPCYRNGCAHSKADNIGNDLSISPKHSSVYYGHDTYSEDASCSMPSFGASSVPSAETGHHPFISTPPQQESLNSNHFNSSNNDRAFSCRPPPLCGRRLQLLKYNGLFLICFVSSVLLGILLHHSKFHRIKTSLSIEGFESFLSPPSQHSSFFPSFSSSETRKINLGALLASDLLLRGWGTTFSSDPYRSDPYQSDPRLQLKQSEEVASKDEPIEFLSKELSDTQLASLSKRDTIHSMCHIHQDLIHRAFCPVSELPDSSRQVEWISHPLSCSSIDGKYLQQELLSSSSAHESPLRQQLSPPLRWRQITPPSVSYEQPVTQRTQSPFGNHNTMVQLQQDVYRLALVHPKLTSLRQQFLRFPQIQTKKQIFRAIENEQNSTSPATLTPFSSSENSVRPQKDNSGDNQTSNCSDDVPDTITDIIYNAQRLLDFFESIDLHFYAIGTTTPNGFLDNAIWFVRGHSISWMARRVYSPTQFSPNEDHSLPSTTEAFSNDNFPFKQSTPYRLLQRLNFHWDITEALFGMVGRQVVSIDESRSSPIDPADTSITLLPHWIRSENPGGQHLLWLFKWSGGLLTPKYPLHLFIQGVLNSGIVYIALFICWIHSLGSPNPVTLVHFPRLVVYQVIVLYRIVVLYFLGGFLESLAGTNNFDYSDHIVFCMTVGLILCLECTAAERSHRRVPIIVMKGSMKRSPQSNGNAENDFSTHTIRGDRDECQEAMTEEENEEKKGCTLSSKSKGIMGFVELCFNRDAEDPVSGVGADNNSISPIETHRKKSGMRHSTKSCPDNIVEQQQIRWKWPFPVQFVHWYSLILLILLCYSSFFTALFFHHPRESMMGLVVGFFGLYLPFWLLVGGCLSLNKFGILRGDRQCFTTNAAQEYR